MKIAYLLGTAGGQWGGLERHTFDLAAAMAAQGHQVCLFADQPYQCHCPAGVSFTAIAWQYPRWHPYLYANLWRKLGHFQPDVVHAQGNKAAQLLRGLKPFCSACCCATVHGTKKNMRAFAAMDGVIAVSRRLAEAVLPQLPHARVTVIHNGITPQVPADEQLAHCRQDSSAFARPLTLAIGRLSTVKGFDVLLQAWSDDLPGSLLILGDGPEKAALRALITQRNLEHKVHLLGHRNDVTAWLSDADLFVLSSRREGFPYVLVEALQAGCAVVATAVAGVEDCLPAAQLVPPESTTALHHALHTALAGLDAWRQQQHDARIQARTTLTLTAMQQQTEQFYRQLLSVCKAD